MAAKTSGRSSSTRAKGSGPSKQSKTRKQTTAHKGQGGSGKSASRRKEQTQPRRRGPGERQPKGGGRELQSQQNHSQPGVARRAAQSVKRHPVKAAVIAAGAAGAGVMLVKRLRKAISSNDSTGEGDEQESAQEDDEEHAGAQASQDDGEGDDEQQQDDDDDDSLSWMRGARAAYDRGREAGINLAEDHPLLLAAAALLTGAAIGWMLPSTRQEDQLIGSFSDKVPGNLKKNARGMSAQGQEMLSQAISEGADALAKEAEREGLTPQRLGRKLKRMAGHVREAVGGVIEA